MSLLPNDASTRHTYARWTISLFLFLLPLCSSGAFSPPIEYMLLPLVPVLPFAAIIAMDFQPRLTPRMILQSSADSDNGPLGNDKQILCCFGDSLTHGSCSANFVTRLENRVDLGTGDAEREWIIVNAGVNSETSTAAANRLSDIIRMAPAAVTILLGTNDLIGSLDPDKAGRMYQSKLRLDVPPSESGLLRQLCMILHELHDQLPSSSRILIMSPPPLGEGGVEDAAWIAGRRISRGIQKVVDEFHNQEKSARGIRSSSSDNHQDRIVFVDLFTRVKEDMESRQAIERRYQWKSLVPLQVLTSWRVFLGASLVEARENNGFKYTTDSVHFGPEFASIVEDTIVQWMALREEET